MAVKNSNKHTSSSNQSDADLLDNYIEKKLNKIRLSKKSSKNGDKAQKFVKIALIVLLGFFLMRAASNFSFNSIPSVFNTVITNGPSEDLLNRMNIRMTEMGYTGLNHDELRELRQAGVTATYISNVRSIGFQDLTLDQAVSLARADASSAFLAMMIELGYGDLTVEDFVDLRDAGVTAHFTSNIHDYGYRDVTKDQLIRLRRIGVTTSLIESLQQGRGEEVPLEEIIRYRISNQ